MICPGKVNVSARKTFLRVNHFVTVFALDEKTLTLLTCCAILLDICKTTASRTVRTQRGLSVTVHSHSTMSDELRREHQNTGLLDFKCCTRISSAIHAICVKDRCRRWIEVQLGTVKVTCEDWGGVWALGSQHWSEILLFALFNSMSCWSWFLSLACCFVMFSGPWTLVWNCVCVYCKVLPFAENWVKTSVCVWFVGNVKSEWHRSEDPSFIQPPLPCSHRQQRVLHQSAPFVTFAVFFFPLAGG